MSSQRPTDRSRRSRITLDRVLDRFTFGGRVPGGVGLILAVTIVTSLVTAFGDRKIGSLFELVSLVPEQVLHGQLWRLLTWSFVESSPLSLLFGCLMLFWFGRDLSNEWGSRRFFVVYLGVAVVASCGTCLLALVDRDVMSATYLGSVPLAEAVTVAWGLWFPDRVIRIYFVIPIKGIVIAWGTVALTVAYAVYSGWHLVLPNLLAEGAMLAWLHRAPALKWWGRQKQAREQAARKEKARKRNEGRTASVHVLYKLEEHDDDLPPLSPEMEDKIGSIIDQATRDARNKPDDKPS